MKEAQERFKAENPDFKGVVIKRVAAPKFDEVARVPRPERGLPARRSWALVEKHFPPLPSSACRNRPLRRPQARSRRPAAALQAAAPRPRPFGGPRSPGSRSRDPCRPGDPAGTGGRCCRTGRSAPSSAHRRRAHRGPGSANTSSTWP